MTYLCLKSLLLQPWKSLRQPVSFLHLKRLQLTVEHLCVARVFLQAGYCVLHSCCHLSPAVADYFNDITTFVEPGFSRRTCEGVLEELVRRSSSYALAVMDRSLAAAAAAMGVAAQGGVDPSDLVLTRMAQDERDVQVGLQIGCSICLLLGTLIASQHIHHCDALACTCSHNNCPVLRLLPVLPPPASEGLL